LLAVAFLLSYVYTEGCITEWMTVCAGIIAGSTVMAGQFRVRDLSQACQFLILRCTRLAWGRIHGRCSEQEGKATTGITNHNQVEEIICGAWR